MNEGQLRGRLAGIMLWGVLLAAGVMLVGVAVYLAHHAGIRRGSAVHGEPADLRHPVAIVQTALRGNDDCWMQVGVLLLLFNPLVRVALAAWGYAAARDRLYAGIASLVFAVLVVSYFV